MHPGVSLSTFDSAMRRAAADPQRPINHNCFNSINDVFRRLAGYVCQVHGFVGVFPSCCGGQQTAQIGADASSAWLCHVLC